MTFLKTFTDVNTKIFSSKIKILRINQHMYLLVENKVILKLGKDKRIGGRT